MRALLPHELVLLNRLFEVGQIAADPTEISVESLEDGKMGSFAIAPFEANRKFGLVAAECHFVDQDNNPVSVQLSLDQNGKLYEVDIWKVNFLPVLSWPAKDQVFEGPIPTILTSG